MGKWNYDLNNGQMNFNWQLFICLSILYFFIAVVLSDNNYKQMKLRYMVVWLKNIVLFLIINCISYQFNLTRYESSILSIMSDNNKEILHVHKGFDEIDIKNVYVYDGSYKFFSSENIYFTLMIIFGRYVLKIFQNDNF